MMQLPAISKSTSAQIEETNLINPRSTSQINEGSLIIPRSTSQINEGSLIIPRNTSFLINENNEKKKKHWVKQEIELFPNNQYDIWDKRSVSCFINELDEFKKSPRRAYYTFIIDGIRTSVFNFIHQKEPLFYISVHVSFSIHVYASVFWIFTKWNKKEK